MLKRIFVLTLAGVMMLAGGLLIGCEEEPAEEANENENEKVVEKEVVEKEEVVKEAEWPVWDLRDGDYRGHFDDREHNVSLQLTVEDEEIVEAGLRWQKYDGIVYEEDPEVPEDYVFDEEQIEGMANQYEEALNYIEGAQGVEEIVERTEHMEGTPEDTPVLDEIETEVDGVSAATIRSGKLGSAIRDAFNRGRYRE